MPKDTKPKRQIKYFVSENDHDAIRLAAALCQMTMAEFCREVAIQEARELTKDIKLPAGRRKRKTSGPG